MSSYNKKRGLRPSPTGWHYEECESDVFSKVLANAKDAIEGRSDYYENSKRMPKNLALLEVLREAKKIFQVPKKR